MQSPPTINASADVGYVLAVAHPSPPPAVVRLDDHQLVPLEPEHAPLLLELATLRGNPHLIELGSDADQIGALLAQLKVATWSLPVALLSDELCIGMATTALPDTKSLHVSLLTMFVDPPASSRALALYLRHVFWTFPVGRIHVQVPDLDVVREYVALYESVGFVDEGRLVDHVIVAGQPFDVITLGLLRRDFVAWVEEHEPRLALG